MNLGNIENGVIILQVQEYFFGDVTPYNLVPTGLHGV
jgi:hypothetical protein